MSNRRFNRALRPDERILEVIDFDGVKTEKDGSYTLKFGNVTALLDENNEIALERFHADVSEFDNIAANTRSVQVVKPNSKPQTVHFPACKIATVEELINILNLMQEVVVFGHGEIGVTMTMKARAEITFDKKVAKCLGFMANDGHLSGLVQAFLRDDVNLGMTGESLTVEKIKGDGTFTLFVRKENYIWNTVSDLSFQHVLVSTDVMQREFVGSDLSQTLGVVPFFADKLRIDYAPRHLDWKRVNGRNIRQIVLSLHTSTGRALENIHFFARLKIRRRPIH